MRRDPHFPQPTIRGWIAMGFILGCGFAGLQGGNNLLFLLACLNGGLVAACFWRCLINLDNLQVERHIPYPIHAKSVFPLTLSLTNESRFRHANYLLLLEYPTGAGAPQAPIFTALPTVPPGTTRTAQLMGWFSRRGKKELLRIELVSYFPFGLFRHCRTVDQTEELLVYPRLRRIPNQLISSLPEWSWTHQVPTRSFYGEEEIAGLREFRQGDNPKWIHWKSSARPDNKLLVREFEVAALRRTRLILDAYLPEQNFWGETQLERAVEMTASLALDLAGRGFVVEVLIRRQDETRFEVRPHDRSLFSLFHLLATLEGARAPRPKSLPPIDMPTIHIDPGQAVRGETFGRLLAWRA